MKNDVMTILGSELLCGLGGRSERLSRLRQGKPRILAKTLEVNGETLRYPYYLIKERGRPVEKEEVLEALLAVTVPLLEKTGMDAARRARCGLLMGSSSNDHSLAMSLGRNSFHGEEATMPRQRVGNGYCAEELRKALDLGGPELTYNTACTSSANALLDAASLLRCGMMEYALVVGLEFFTPVTLDGFTALQLLTREAVRPFDRDRSGFVLGETANALLLGRRAASSMAWELLGGMSNCETFSITGANPDGAALAGLMQKALQTAGVSADQIDVIKAHGTASEQSDRAEINAMKRVFPTVPPFLSLKPFLGHTLGGCATGELILFMEAIDAGFVPRTIHFRNMDAALGLVPLQRELPLREGTFMMNFFGFGGNNTSFVVRKAGR